MQKGVDYTGITVVFCCHDGQGRFVMAKRSDNSRDEAGRWDIGGGGLKFNEPVEDGLQREIKEEYCADVLSHELLGFRDVHREHEGKLTHWIALDYLALVDPRQVAIGDPEKLVKLEWFSLDSKPPKEHSHSQLPVFWKQYTNQLQLKLLQKHVQQR